MAGGAVLIKTAATITLPKTVRPVPAAERIWAIDALRGLALLGVLAINLHTEFRVSLFEQFLAPPRASGLDGMAATFLSFAFEFKAISLFSILFGVGLAIQHERLARSPRRLPLLFRRLLALLAFGLIHLFLIWNGDILTEYALAGLIVLPFLFAPVSASLTGAAFFLLLYFSLSMLQLPILPDPSSMGAHVIVARHIYGTGGFIEVLRFRVAEVPQIAKLLAYIFPRTLALILLGAWLWRSGAVRELAERKAELLAAGTLLLAGGFILTAQSKGYVTLVHVGPASGAALKFIINALNEVAPVLVALGYAALVLLGSGFPRCRAALQWAVPVGRTAFSNYILQSVVLGWIFYGYGLGLMGHVGAAAGIIISFVIFAVQAWLSAAWLRTHRFGPLEWLWRTLMYGERQPWIRRSANDRNVGLATPG